mmetsp:Transcript_4394/g.12330  ORF Transcript_4394/g.12330 Transcript_4394/m.12330 type:complete len:466 (+) Transcript_4394:120-1517(+)
MAAWGRSASLLPSVSNAAPFPRKQLLSASDDPADGAATVFGSILSVANSVVGAGMLSLPYLLRESSLLMGMVVIVITCTLSIYSFYILGASCELAGRFDYKGLGAEAGGPHFAVMIQVAMILYTAGACISYAVLLGDFSTGLVQAIDTEYWTAAKLLSSHGSAVTTIGLLVLTPLSCVRDLKHLEHSSALALLCDFVTVGVVIYSSANAPVAPDINWATPSPAVFLVMPIVAVACSTHYNAPRFYEELKDRSLEKMGQLSVAAMGLATLVYIVVSVAGYLQFGGATKGDILNCYSGQDTLAIVARLCLATHIALTFPVIFNSTRANMHSLLWSHSEGEDPSTTLPLSHFQSAAYACVLVPVLVAVAANVPEVHEVLAFNGALLGTLIAYTFPGYIFYSLEQRREATARKVDGAAGPAAAADPGSRLWSVWAPLGCVWFGLLMMVTGTVSITMQKLGLVTISATGH